MLMREPYSTGPTGLYLYGMSRISKSVDRKLISGFQGLEEGGIGDIC